MYSEFLPPFYLPMAITLLGLIIGSFLDVIVCRFHTGKSINGRSRCMSCGHTLSWYELFPLFSYLILRGKCKHCGGHIPLRLLCMELMTSALFLAVYISSQSILFFVFGIFLVSLLIVIASYDMRHMVIPNEFVIATMIFALAYISYEAYVTVEFGLLLSHVIAALGCSAFFALLWLISKGRWIGLGDAKLVFPLALMLTVSEAFSLIVFSFWIGAGLSILLLGLQKLLQSGKRHLPFLRVPLTMKSEVPFAPFMIAAFVVVFLTHLDVLSIIKLFSF